MDRNNNKDFGLILPGQGQYGMSYFGQIRQFNEFKFYPSLIVSTSMGSYQGQFLQFQIEFQKYFDFLNHLYNLFNDILDYIVQGIESVNNFISNYGIYNSEKVIDIVKQYIPDDWSKMKIPIKIVTYDVIANKEHIFGYEQDQSIPPYLAVIQSGQIAPFLTPIKQNNTYYIDGGYVNNLPINLVKEIKTNIILSPQQKYHPVNKINNVFDFYIKLITNLVNIANEMYKDNVDNKYYKIITGVKNIDNFFDFKQYKSNMDLGYSNTKNFIYSNEHLFF